MLCVAEVFRRMFVLRVVTAADVPARETESQVHPIITPLQAILASVRQSSHPSAVGSTSWI
jgi:hypothetical protein